MVMLSYLQSKFTLGWLYVKLSLLGLTVFFTLLGMTTGLSVDTFHTCVFQDTYLYSIHNNPDSTADANLPIGVRDFFVFVVLRVVQCLTVGEQVYKLQHKDQFKNALQLPKDTIIMLSVFLSTMVSSALIFAFDYTYTYFPYIKSFLHDTECTRDGLKQNGVSGHTYYLLLHLVIFFYASGVYEKYKIEHILSLYKVGYVVIAHTQVTTYYYGYHTLRQMFLGATLGIAFGLLVCYAFEYAQQILHSIQRTRTDETATLQADSRDTKEDKVT